MPAVRAAETKNAFEKKVCVDMNLVGKGKLQGAECGEMEHSRA
jgi:hypothetical protein